MSKNTKNKDQKQPDNKSEEKISLQELMDQRYNETQVNYLSKYLDKHDNFIGHFHDLGAIYGKFGKQNAFYFTERDDSDKKWCLTSNDPVVYEIITQHIIKSDELIKIWKDKEQNRWKLEFYEQ